MTAHTITDTPWFASEYSAICSPEVAGPGGEILSLAEESGTTVADRSMKSPLLHTKRLVLRRWTEQDRDAFAQINGDPEVMQYRLRTLTRHESDSLMDAIEACFEQNGFGQWAVERTDDRRVIGFIGLELADTAMPFRPLVHVGWHLATDVWHHGYAIEGAGAVLDYAFDKLDLSEVVAHTTALNERSRAVMRRLGMTHDPVDDFDAPWYEAGHPNRRFVLYRLPAAVWRARWTNTRTAAPNDSASGYGTSTPECA